MRAGKLRHLIQLQAVTKTTNSHGEEVRTWPTSVTDDDATDVWAEVKDLSGRELLIAQQASSEATVRVRTRYVAGVTPADYRILYGDRILQIVHDNNVDGRDRELELLCQEVV